LHDYSPFGSWLMRFPQTARLAGIALLLTLTATPAGAAASCEQAGTEAEKAFNLPHGLLLAIGRVESGRWDDTRTHVIAWPWTIDVAGEGRQFASAVEAVRTTQALRDRGARNIDVGCFQVSLLHHPDAFKDLNEAFDPEANGQYAGRLLASLKARLGSWTEAIAAYHSADPARGLRYRRLVFASWLGAPVPAETVLTPGLLPFGIHLWTPSRSGEAPRLIQIGAARPLPLPRVIGPGG
jgi:hypothetical protein